MFQQFKARLWTFIPLIALYFAVVWAGQSIGSLRPVLYGMPARGTVTAVARCHNGDGTPDGTVELTVAFRDAHGAARSYRESQCYPYRFGVRHALTVRYFAGDPRQVATQNDLDRLAPNVLWLVGLLFVASLCAGVLLVAAITFVSLDRFQGVARRAATAAVWVGSVLIGLGGLGVIVCFVISINAGAVADQNLGNPKTTATATAQVIRVTNCLYSTGGGDAIGGALARLGRASGILQPADNSHGEQPTVSFVDRSGLSQQMEIDECDPLYRVGMQVRMTYLLSDPTRHFDDGPNSNTPNPDFDSCLFFLEYVVLGAIILGILVFLWNLAAGARIRWHQRPLPVARQPVARRRVP